MITAISTSMLSDVFCSPTAGVEETQTTSSLRSLASPLAGDQLEPSYTPFNSTVDFYTFMWSMGGNFFTQIMISIAGGLKPRKAICSLSINRGGCQANFHHHHHHIHHHHHHHHHHNLPLCYQAKLRRFYFDLRTESCKLFVFGGCQGRSAFISGPLLKQDSSRKREQLCHNARVCDQLWWSSVAGREQNNEGGVYSHHVARLALCCPTPNRH